MTYQEMCKASKEDLQKEPCRCVRCDDCKGSGNVEYRTNSYPEWDLESCDSCRGTGIVEDCDRCQLLYEMEYEEYGA